MAQASGDSAGDPVRDAERGGSVQSVQPGMDCLAACSLEWDGGTQIVLRARPDSGKKLLRWSGACSGRAECSLTLTQPAAVQAVFAPDAYRLAVSRIGKGAVRAAAAALVCPARCSASVESYVPLTLRAVPASGLEAEPLERRLLRARNDVQGSDDGERERACRVRQETDRQEVSHSVSVV